MDDIRQFLTDGVEAEFAEAVRLNDKESKNDPETEPYRSMYRAREIWHKLKSDIVRRRESTPDLVQWMFLEAALDLKLGINYMDTEEKSTGEERLASCLSAVDTYCYHAEACCIIQTALNHTGILNCERSEQQRGLEFLQRAELLYKDFSDKVGGAPWTVNDLFHVDSYDSCASMQKLVKNRMENFEDTYTHTLYYLAQAHGKVGNSAESAKYCRMTLRRQLSNHKYEPVDWAVNAATLSQYYIMESDFMHARHCLASGQFILKQASESINQSSEETSDHVHKAWADLYRCWAKYGLALLEHSRERLYSELDADSPPTGEQIESAEQSTELDDIDKNERDNLFDLELTAIESKITDRPVCVFDEARNVFKAVQAWLEAAKVFYALDGHCSDHIEIVQDHSRLYKIIAFFEPDLERQCRMHKRRADMLDIVLKQLNQQYYLLVCRQLMFELGEIFSTMLDNKLALIEQSQSPPNEHARAKINILSERSIERFQAYVNSLRDSEGKLPDRFQEDDERPALIAHFYMGRLYSKFMDFDVPTRLRNMKNSIDNYNFLVEYCKNNPDATKKVKPERDLCEEMVVLLPAKMENIRASAE